MPGWYAEMPKKQRGKGEKQCCFTKKQGKEAEKQHRNGKNKGHMPFCLSCFPISCLLFKNKACFPGFFSCFSPLQRCFPSMQRYHELMWRKHSLMLFAFRHCFAAFLSCLFDFLENEASFSGKKQLLPENYYAVLSKICKEAALHSILFDLLFFLASMPYVLRRSFYCCGLWGNKADKENKSRAKQWLQTLSRRIALPDVQECDATAAS